MLALGGAALVPACAPIDPRHGMEAYMPAQRIDAIQAAARSEDPRLISALVDRLDDEDVSVRMAAIQALMELTGKRLGYAGWASLEERRESVDAWRNYVAIRAAKASRETEGQPSLQSDVKGTMRERGLTGQRQFRQVSSVPATSGDFRMARSASERTNQRRASSRQPGE